MSEVNPYQQPEAEVVRDGALPDQMTLGGPHKITVGQAMSWIGDGMKLVSGHWGVVIGALLVIFLLATVVQFVPLIGPLAQPFLMTLLYGGLVKMFHRIDTTGQSDFTDLFAGFSQRTGPLLLLSLAQLGVFIAIGLLVGVGVLMFAGTGAAMSQGMDPGLASGGMSVGVLLMALLGLAVMVLVAFLFYFTVPLVMLTDTGPGRAMALSFKACTANLAPILIYGLVAMVIVALGAIPALLGWLFVMPILAGAFYLSFKQILTES
ncbi:BPSS1780 family membrane protein [Alloalcanivorax gelatiniphagus]|uniref:Chromosome partitioning protein ParB n=1 Tax=Alloalcanivorax gelatiniphagus TaxID=1194167 RepID=A0ABY2XGX5_9GAMM|nr:BPSS1780 family membrane protein [Alloalcanivorax gelatiniphagus]TMW10571.1 chromosome partitioning protein ParB [Alloalcanivorax gelatiniphagus]